MDPQPFRSKTKANSAHLLYLRGPASSNSLTHLAALSYGGTIKQKAIRPGFWTKDFYSIQALMHKGYTNKMCSVQHLKKDQEVRNIMHYSGQQVIPGGAWKISCKEKTRLLTWGNRGNVPAKKKEEETKLKIQVIQDDESLIFEHVSPFILIFECGADDSGFLDGGKAYALEVHRLWRWISNL